MSKIMSVSSRLFGVFVLAVFLSACASYGVIENKQIEEVSFGKELYSVEAFNHRLSGKKTAIILAFSGGGTRAAALSYGVLSELNETFIDPSNPSKPLLDDVAIISSVSGGSFTAAYYGLHGDKTFDEFEQRFLKKNVERALVSNFINPLRWFSRKGRIEFAINYYDREIFDGATFSDMLRPDRPMVLINATDLSKGVRFSFMQEYFNLLCSDLTDFSISRAVAASSAVPLLFNPVVVKNHAGCLDENPQWLTSARGRAQADPELSLLVKGLESYFNKEGHQYAHFVDGGITDNLGLRSVFDITKLLGGARKTNEIFNIDAPERLVVISVDASASPDYDIANSPNPPGFLETVNATTDIQLHRYNTATLSDVQKATQVWAEDLSGDTKRVEAQFVRLSFDGVSDSELRKSLNRIPTSFSLETAQVDLLIKTGRELLRNNSAFLKVIEEIKRQ